MARFELLSLGFHSELRVSEFLAFTMRTALKNHHPVATTPIAWPSESAEKGKLGFAMSRPR